MNSKDHNRFKNQRFRPPPLESWRGPKTTIPPKRISFENLKIPLELHSKQGIENASKIHLDSNLPSKLPQQQPTSPHLKTLTDRQANTTITKAGVPSQSYKETKEEKEKHGFVKYTPPSLKKLNTGLVVRSIGKQFKKRPVLRDVSLHLQRGEAVGLLGPNGAGKTTSFYIVTGLMSADYGQICLDGRDITKFPMYRRSQLGIGYLPQEASIFRGLNVEQNIMSVLELIEVDRNRRHELLDNLLAEFSITHLRTSPSVALSGGERRRMEIARALASRPHFILLDEPLAGIDPIAVRDIRELVRHLKDRNIGVLITDHNVHETLDIVDRAYILHDGKVLREGPPSQIIADEDVKRLYLGDSFQMAISTSPDGMRR